MLTTMTDPIIEPSETQQTGDVAASMDNGTAVHASQEAGTVQPPALLAARAADLKDPWICKSCGAIIGVVHKEKIRAGLSISRLILFRGAVKFDEMLPANFVFGKVDAGEFGCSRCGEVRAWHPSPETLRYLGESPRHVRKKNPNL